MFIYMNSNGMISTFIDVSYFPEPGPIRKPRSLLGVWKRRTSESQVGLLGLPAERSGGQILSPEPTETHMPSSFSIERVSALGCGCANIEWDGRWYFGLEYSTLLAKHDN